MTKHTVIAAAMALAALGASANDNNETMYLVKGNRVVAKYPVDQVEYISFNLPDDVLDEALWLTVDKVGKNTVTYTVNTADNSVAYAHNLLSYYDVNYVAMDYFGDMLENLDPESAHLCIQYALASNAFFGIGSQTFTQNDFEQYSNYSEANRFSVVPGTKYYLCAWEADSQTQEPKETFVYTELTTEAPELVNLDLKVEEAGYNSEGIVFNFTGSQDILYVRTCWGLKDTMEAYAGAYGMDFLMGTFGQSWSLDFLSGTGDLAPGIENATWPVYDQGEYIMYVRAYDFDGNMQQIEYTVTYTSSGDEEVPVITVVSKEKSEDHVKINFEISPSNVEEAYVRLLDENTVDDRLNLGYTYPELAMGGNSTDITKEINTTGEYTFETNEVIADHWNSILIYAKCKDGGVTTLRLNFFPDNDSEWSTYPAFHAPAKRKIPAVNRIRRAGSPAIRRAGK